MANHKSAKKRAIQAVGRNQRNKAYLSKVKTSIKKLRLSIDSLKAGKSELAETQGLFRESQSLLAKAAAKGILHKNNASRRVARLSHAIATATPEAK